MDREKLESMLIDYIDGKLSGGEREFIENEISQNAVTRKLYEELKEVISLIEVSAPANPSAALRKSFFEMVEQEKASVPVRRLSPVFYRIAAAVALLVLGAGAGFFISDYRSTQQELARLKEEKRRASELAYRITSTSSAAQRIIAVRTAGSSGDSLQDEIVDALVKTLNEDDNTNVRLAALEALYRFSGEERVRKELVSALPKQHDPVIQITLIQMLVEMKDSRVLKPLEQIIKSEEVLPAVKDEAYRGVMVLS